MTITEADLTAADVSWDLEPLLDGSSVDALLERAEALAAELTGLRGRVASLDRAGLAAAMRRLGEVQELLGRAGNYASLRFATDTVDPARGALMQKVQERSTTRPSRTCSPARSWPSAPTTCVRNGATDPTC